MLKCADPARLATMVACKEVELRTTVDKTVILESPIKFVAPPAKCAPDTLRVIVAPCVAEVGVTDVKNGPGAGMTFRVTFCATAALPAKSVAVALSVKN